jgi:hypothetical protein
MEENSFDNNDTYKKSSNLNKKNHGEKKSILKEFYSLNSSCY